MTVSYEEIDFTIHITANFEKKIKELCIKYGLDNIEYIHDEINYMFECMILAIMEDENESGNLECLVEQLLIAKLPILKRIDSNSIEKEICI